MRPSVLIVWLLPGLIAASGQASPVPVDSARVLADIRYLASPPLEGRRTGEPGADSAAAYIARRFRELGLKPLGDNGTFLQHFEATVGVRDGGHNELSSLSGSRSLVWRPDSDFVPLGFSENDSLKEVPVVLVGYGITSEDKGHDDYAGIDVKGKAVMFFRRVPGAEDSGAVFGRADRSPFADLRYKASNAFNHGAVAALVVDGPRGRRQDRDVPLRLLADQGVGGAHIPVLSIRREVAAAIAGVAVGGERAGAGPGAAMDALEQLQERSDLGVRGFSSQLQGANISLRVNLLRDRRHVANVVGELVAPYPGPSNEALVIGAHYDHLGWGGQGSLEPDKHAIHYGADDNASGSAGVMELARVMSADPSQLRRSLVFVCFTGEEEGLFGSGYFVGHAPMPLERVAAMLNMDMIGRLQGDKLTVGGTGTSPAFPGALQVAAAAHGLKISSEASGYGPSDHTSFYAKGRPVLFFFTGAHSDYHKSTDTWDKINAPGEARILEMVHDVVQTLAMQGTAIPFNKVLADTGRAAGGEGYGGGGYGPYFGTVPDFGDNPDIKGVLLSGVREGSPAEKAGVMGGDILVNFGGKVITNLYDYTYALRAHKPGDVVEVEVSRKGQSLKLVAILAQRK